MNKNLSKIISVFTATMSIMLTGCGGGATSTGSGATQPPVAVQTCPNGATNFPTCTPYVVPADLQTVVPKPTYPAGSNDLKAFEYLNNFRASLGLGLLAQSPELDLAAKNHTNYVTSNTFLPGDSFHFEKPSGVGFTGVSPIDRARFAGYATNGWVSENAAISNTQPGAIQGLIDTIYHRADLARQNYRDVGFYWYEDPHNYPGGLGQLVLNPGYKTPQRNASDFVTFYPVNGQTNVDLAFAGETPDPFPQVPNSEKVNRIGYPIYFAVESNQTLDIKSFTITELGQSTPLDAWVLTKKNDPNLIYLQANEAHMCAMSALKPLTTYQVSVVATADGRDVSRKWQFKTAEKKSISF